MRVPKSKSDGISNIFIYIITLTFKFNFFKKNFRKAKKNYFIKFSKYFIKIIFIKKTKFKMI